MAKKKAKVVIEVWGGVAYVTKRPRGVEVEIIDHDNEEAEADEASPVPVARRPNDTRCPG
jgi:hypothetical protein